MTVQKTYIPKGEELTNDWYLVDAGGQTLGRVATKIATVILGKHKPSFTPGVLGGDFVVVINADQVKVTGKKLEDKIYYHHTGYPGGIRSISLRQQLAKHPDRVIRRAVWGMIPHNKAGRKMIKRLKVYAGPEHPHAPQNPKILE
jgi:large subunit ribosomal protein L13